MTLGKKIALGFGVLIFISAALGVMAVVTMRSAQNTARLMATEYVPESAIASDLQASLLHVQLFVRSYGLTAEDTYLEEARTSLVELHKLQQTAQKLAVEHPNLVKLRDHLQTFDPALKKYEELISQTQAKNKDIQTSRDRMNKSAADFLSNTDKLAESQRERLEQEMKSFSEVGKLQERLRKLSLTRDIRGEGDAARVVAFKAQALRDVKLMDDGLKHFEVMDRKFDELLATLKVQEDITELNKVKTDAHEYRDAMKAIVSDTLALNEIAKTRWEQAQLVDRISSETQAAGTQRTMDAAHSSARALASASWMLVVGLVAAIITGGLVAFFIIRGTTRVLSTVTDTISSGAEQTASAAGQVSAASQSLAEGASEQAASLEETSSSLEEMSSMTKRNAENALHAKETAARTRQSADTGADQMKTLLASMDAIKAASEDITKILKNSMRLRSKPIFWP